VNKIALRIIMVFITVWEFCVINYGDNLKELLLIRCRRNVSLLRAACRIVLALAQEDGA
jgi:hypothetical protein